MIQRRTRVWAVLLAVLALMANVVGAAAGGSSRYEVWLIDQADTVAGSGGRLFIYGSRQVEGTGGAPEVIDLAGDARDLCLAQTGSAPQRPHMLAFDPSQRYGVLAFVATGHVLFIDARSRRPVTCIDVGAQAHAAFPSPNGRYVVVANQNGKLLQRISTNFRTGSFTLDPLATLDLANGTTPSGALRQDPSLRPDNAPICPVVSADSRLTFVTLRGGGLFVVDSKASPMAIVAEYDRSAVRPNGCGGLQSDGKMYLTSGGGTAATPYAADVYSCRIREFSTATAAAPNTPALKTVFQTADVHTLGVADAHGAVLTKNDRYLWVGDRALNKVTVVSTRTDTIVATIPLAGPVSSDPAPDLFAISPDGKHVFAALRGPNPLTGNAPAANNAVGATPGLAIIEVRKGGRNGVLQTVLPVSRLDAAGVERADPHAVAVRRR